MRLNEFSLNNIFEIILLVQLVIYHDIIIKCISIVILWHILEIRQICQCGHTCFLLLYDNN